MGKLITREQQEVENTWDLSSIFESDQAFDQAFESIESKLDQAEKFKGGFDSSDKLLEALKTERELGNELSKLYVYAHLKHDQDTSNDTYSAMETRARGLAVKFSSAWSFLVPAIMEIPEDTLQAYAEEDSFKEFKFAD